MKNEKEEEIDDGKKTSRIENASESKPNYEYDPRSVMKCYS